MLNKSASAAPQSPIALDGNGFGGGPVRQPSVLRNRAGTSKSPFINSNQDSLVQWQLLDADSVQQAERENKLIFLHIGYKACHFCRIMAHECFSNRECAAILNQSFIPVLVDRDERPDIDAIYMNYVQAVSSVGGWPLNIFVTPELEPVFGGTFWPGPYTSRRSMPENEEEPPDFLTILIKVNEIWGAQEARCRKEASDITSQLREFAAEGTLGTRGVMAQSSLGLPGPNAQHPVLAVSANRAAPVSSELDLDQVEEAYTHIAGTFDPVYAGFGLATKFPTPPRLKFLLGLRPSPPAVHDIVGEAECQHATIVAVETLRRIRDGALRDHVGGEGFTRCSVTRDWTLPNFEKLVADNALLLGLFLDAWLVSGARMDGEFFDIVCELVEYLTSEPIALAGGGFASSEAADSYYRRGDTELREGAWYMWTKREFESVLDATDRQVSPVAAAYWDVREDGNVDEKHDPNDDFINQNILRAVKTYAELAVQFTIPVATVETHIQQAKRALNARRYRERVRPEVDDQIVTATNGLVISTLARTGASLKDVAPGLSSRCFSKATEAVRFIQRHLWSDDVRMLHRIWRDGRGMEGFADDYAYLIAGLLDLFEATGDEAYVEFADTLQIAQIRLLHDPAGAFFSTTTSTPHAILRLKEGMDTALPSTNAVSASNLSRLGRLLDDAYFSDLACATVNAFEPEMLQYPWLFPGLLDQVVVARLGDLRAGARTLVEYKSRRHGSGS